MLNYIEKFNYLDYNVDVEIFYMFTNEGKLRYLYHTFFVLKDGEVLENFPEEIIDFVQINVDDIFSTKSYRLIPNA